MAQIYNTISIVAFSFAGIGLIVSLIIWFKFGIWEIIGDLSGRTAKKSISQMRAENEKSGKKSYRPSTIARERGGITEAVEEIKIKNISQDGLKEKNNEKVIQAVEKTLPLSEVTAVLGEETAILSDSTQMLSEKTDILSPATELLSSSERVPSTEILSENSWGFEMLQDIILVHTNEAI